MESAALNYAVQALYLVMMLSMPPIVVASIVGVLLSLIQAITQLQEQTLTFGVKLIAVVVTLFVMGSWLGADCCAMPTRSSTVFICCEF
ncbi:MAG: type III secretion system export apparatus subunit SctS [Deltaproteobacteria bacterium]|nr:type III secretion system export apparatus subunit SctS [Deltaproteobacteria bacterium]